uniref:General transcription factor IIH subunit 4 n=1 Tax=Plectus sambesii TaxID=2011161 RepID=A0A914UX75_9BILA
MNGRSPEENKVIGFLLSQDAKVLDELYKSPSSALAVYRLLPTLAQQWIARVAFLPKPLPIATLESWVNAKSTDLCQNATSLLSRLRLAHVQQKEFSLSPSFKQSIMSALTEGEFAVSAFEQWTGPTDKSRKSTQELEKKALERWECLLQYLALPSDQTQGMVSVEMRQILAAAGLTGEGTSDLEITSRGFQFLLMDRTTQIWTYVLQYLLFQSRMGKNVVELLALIFRLSFCVAGVAYKLENSWSSAVQDFVQHLRELGLVFMRKRKDGYFFATPLIAHLTSPEAAETKESGSAQGFIIVETNYRVYAYTDSTLQLAILSTFCEMIYRFANMSVGVLTRESVRRALHVGITADQIVGYLRSHVHPQSLGEAQLIPITVADQIRLWELERDRLRFHPAVLYSTFESEQDYSGLTNFSTKEGILLWNQDSSKLVVVTELGHNQVKQWWKMAKKN